MVVFLWLRRVCPVWHVLMQVLHLYMYAAKCSVHIRSRLSEFTLEKPSFFSRFVFLTNLQVLLTI